MGIAGDTQERWEWGEMQETGETQEEYAGGRDTQEGYAGGICRRDMLVEHQEGCEGGRVGRYAAETHRRTGIIAGGLR